MRKLTLILLSICAIGIICNLVWMIHRDRKADAAQHQADEQQLAAQRLNIWNVATSNQFHYDLTRWLDKRYGKSIILDAIYVRDYRNGDVEYSGGRSATVSGMATFTMWRHEDKFFYAAWNSKATLSDAGEWRVSPSFSLIDGEPQGATEWSKTAKVIMPSQRFEELKRKADRLLAH
jgi:hypothetical protein